MTDLANRAHTVYRAYSYSGCLLYVGCTVNLRARLAEHRNSAWWRSCGLVTVEEFASREAALTAEDTAIRTERPALNLMGTGAGLSVLDDEPRIVPHEAPVPADVAAAALVLSEAQLRRLEAEAFRINERLVDALRDRDDALERLSRIAALADHTAARIPA